MFAGGKLGQLEDTNKHKECAIFIDIFHKSTQIEPVHRTKYVVS